MEWNNFAAVLIIILVIAAVSRALVTSRTRRVAPRIALSAPAKPPPVPSETTRGEAVKLLELAAAVYDFFQAAATPSDLVGYGPFERCVDHLKGDGFSSAALLDYYSGTNVVVACAALEALWRRADQPDLSESILDRMNAVAPWPRYFALR